MLILKKWFSKLNNHYFQILDWKMLSFILLLCGIAFEHIKVSFKEIIYLSKRFFKCRLGGTPLMELMIAAGKAVPQLMVEHGLAVDRVYTGSFMTSLDMEGLLL